MKVCIVYSDGDLNEAFPEDTEGRDVVQNLVDVSETLRTMGHEVCSINAGEGFLEELGKAAQRVDVIFSLADEGYNLHTELEPNVVAAFELFGIPYTGAGPLALALCLDKPLAKRLLAASGLPTPRFVLYEQALQELADFDLHFPVIVKPSREDGSIGIKQDSVVDDAQQLLEKINQTIALYKQPVLVEEYIEGREINVAVIGDKQLITLPLSEIHFNLPPGVRNFLFYETKWVEDSVYYASTVPQCPATVEPALRQALEKLAKKAYQALGLKGYGRVDFRINKEGKPYILEVNPNPDICKDAGLARMAKAYGWSYEALLQQIIDIALGKE